MLLLIILAIFSIIIHEVSHGAMAYVLGDDTAQNQGRLTLNPIPHIDLLGTIILPGALFSLSILTAKPLFIFGWAKPVPINPYKLKKPKRDIALVGIAGPLSNLGIAVICGIIAANVNTYYLKSLFNNLGAINIILFTFNMLPVPPLDGSRLITGLLPRNLAIKYSRLEPWGFSILLVCILLDPIRQVIFLTAAIIGSFLGISFF